MESSACRVRPLHPQQRITEWEGQRRRKKSVLSSTETARERGGRDKARRARRHHLTTRMYRSTVKRERHAYEASRNAAEKHRMGKRGRERGGSAVVRKLSCVPPRAVGIPSRDRESAAGGIVDASMPRNGAGFHVNTCTHAFVFARAGSEGVRDRLAKRWVEVLQW